MRFERLARRRKRPDWLPEWVSVAAPTVAAVAGTALVGVLPAIIVTGTKHLALVAVAAGVPFALMLLMGGILDLLLPHEGGSADGGGGPPPPWAGPPDEPPWWPSFEKEFRRHVEQRTRDSVAVPGDTKSDNHAPLVK